MSAAVRPARGQGGPAARPVADAGRPGGRRWLRQALLVQGVDHRLVLSGSPGWSTVPSVAPVANTSGLDLAHDHRRVGPPRGALQPADSRGSRSGRPSPASGCPSGSPRRPRRHRVHRLAARPPPTPSPTPTWSRMSSSTLRLVGLSSTTSTRHRALGLDLPSSGGPSGRRARPLRSASRSRSVKTEPSPGVESAVEYRRPARRPAARASARPRPAAVTGACRRRPAGRTVSNSSAFARLVEADAGVGDLEGEAVRSAEAAAQLTRRDR